MPTPVMSLQIGSSPLPRELETARRFLLVANEAGMAATQALDDAGFGHLSSNSALTVLTKLWMDGASRPRALRPATQLTRGGLSNLLERLEAAGLVTRHSGSVPDDGRAVVVENTRTGNATAKSMSAIIQASLALQGPVADDMDALVDALAPQQRRNEAPANDEQASVARLELLSRAGAALTEAVASANRGDSTPSRTAVVLCCAVEHGGTRPGEIIERTNLSSGGVSQLLDRLEAGRLILRRTGSQPDRRAVIVELTATGRRRLDRTLIEIRARLASI